MHPELRPVVVVRLDDRRQPRRPLTATRRLEDQRRRPDMHRQPRRRQPVIAAVEHDPRGVVRKVLAPRAERHRLGDATAPQQPPRAALEAQQRVLVAHQHPRRVRAEDARPRVEGGHRARGVEFIRIVVLAARRDRADPLPDHIVQPLAVVLLDIIVAERDDRDRPLRVGPRHQHRERSIRRQRPARRTVPPIGEARAGDRVAVLLAEHIDPPDLVGVEPEIDRLAVRPLQLPGVPRPADPSGDPGHHVDHTARAQVPDDQVAARVVVIPARGPRRQIVAARTHRQRRRPLVMLRAVDQSTPLREQLARQPMRPADPAGRLQRQQRVTICTHHLGRRVRQLHAHAGQ